MSTSSSKAAAALALATLALVASPVQAGLFGKKKPVESFKPTPPPPPPPPAAANGAIFQASSGFAALHEGMRARRVGDPLTIVLNERTVATKQASSNTDRNGRFGVELPKTGPFDVLPSGALNMSGGGSFKGTGAADQSNALSGEVSVTVAEVYPNGTMLVRGEKRVTLNRGDEFVRISGIVRTADVDFQNRVLSTRVADAQIAYTGKGDVARASRQGWLSRFFSVVSPF